MTAAKKYTEAELKNTALESFRLGLRIGERRAERTEENSSVDDTMAVANAVGVTRTRGHLTLIQGGKR